jgi:hypothetical protein
MAAHFLDEERWADAKALSVRLLERIERRATEDSLEFARLADIAARASAVLRQTGESDVARAREAVAIRASR